MIVIGAATIRMVLIATALAITGGARPVLHAQETAAPSWGDVGVHWSPLFWLENLDLDYGTPPGVWVTWGTGTFRLQVDYQRSRQQYSIYSGVRMIETYQGQQDTPVYRALQRTAVNHVGEALVYWRVLDHARVSPHLLVGFQYLNIGERRCFATGEPVPREPDGYHVDFAPGEEQRCGNDPLMRRHLRRWVIAGGIDLALGSRVFARLQAQFFQIRLGVGLRF